MPVANLYLGAFHRARVTYPAGLVSLSGDTVTTYSFLPTDPLAVVPSLATKDIVFSRFGSRVLSPSETRELLQGWGGGRFWDTQGIFFVQEISFPLLFTLTTEETGKALALRTAELVVWLSWLRYMCTSSDRVLLNDREISAVVTAAQAQASPETGITLSLSIISNAPLSWALIDTGLLPVNQHPYGRLPSNFDIFVGFRDWASGSSMPSAPDFGWRNRWGINSVNVQYSTSYQTIYKSVGNLTELGVLLDQPLDIQASSTRPGTLTPSEINTKLVKIAGQLSVFGLVSNWTLGSTSISEQRALRYRISPPTSPATIYYPADIFNNETAKGGIQVYIGAWSEIDNSLLYAYPLLYVPQATIIQEANIEAQQGIISLQRSFIGLLSNYPAGA